MSKHRSTDIFFHFGTKLAYRDYPVSAEWVWNLLQSKKLGADTARRELVQTTKSLTRHLPNVEKLIQESIALELGDIIAAKEKILEKSRTPFRELPEVSALLKDLQECRDRRKFLVLDGPSRMGKTMYVKSLFGKDKTLELNCSGEEDPQMQGYKHTQHKCVLFDEAAPEMISKYRKLFQCPNAVVQMAQSKTGCFSYPVYVNDALLVICCNHWKEQLARMASSCTKWIEANQVLISVTEPLFQEAGPTHRAISS